MSFLKDHEIQDVALFKSKFTYGIADLAFASTIDSYGFLSIGRLLLRVAGYLLPR